MALTQSITKTVESGAFVRTIIRKGNKKTQNTIKIKPNQEKVVLGHIGDFEVYVYPFDYPDKVFLGKFPVSTVIESTNVKQILGAYNQMRWFLANKAFSEPSNRKGANMRRQQIQTAYQLALNSKRTKEKGKTSLNYNYTKQIEIPPNFDNLKPEIKAKIIKQLGEQELKKRLKQNKK